MADEVQQGEAHLDCVRKFVLLLVRGRGRFSGTLFSSSVWEILIKMPTGYSIVARSSS